MLAALPLLLLPVTAYAALAVSLGGGFDNIFAAARLSAPLFQLPTRGGGSWPVSTTDLLLAVAIVIAFLELIKGFDDRRIAVTNHVLSIALFLACLAAMLYEPAFDTSAFFMLTLLVLLDMVASISMTITDARQSSPF